ncbi:hypothetical protein B0T10DRAFT_65973 [Thelonectria olida]|uniref:Uncharacterized protein n=1 Tax=Thelonectria olida TaxID=1576542 RepID=A0A9P9AL14_9HYPO|nr:hypothetical protein B0T10DRAFT_65973 [Thelonectria olida]
MVAVFPISDFRLLDPSRLPLASVRGLFLFPLKSTKPVPLLPSSSSASCRRESQGVCVLVLLLLASASLLQKTHLNTKGQHRQPAAEFAEKLREIHLRFLGPGRSHRKTQTTSFSQPAPHSSSLRGVAHKKKKVDDNVAKASKRSPTNQR